ncbi:MAG: hypothetical protein ACJ771_05620 [Chloroflexota bacterium]
MSALTPTDPSPQLLRRTPAFGCAYFGVRDQTHFEADLAEMCAAGFDWVLLPMTQDDATRERETFQALVVTARALGFVTVISPWGGDIFGGEGIAGRLSLEEWIGHARATGADILHVDEPRGFPFEHALDAWGCDERAWLTIQPDRAGEITPSVIARVAVVGTDAYDGDLEARLDATRAFGVASGRLDLAWVQAFRIPAGTEEFVGQVTEALSAMAPIIGVWGWRGSTGRGTLRSDDPMRVQSEVSAAIRRVRARDYAEAVT